MFGERLLTGCVVALALVSCSGESVRTGKDASSTSMAEDWAAYGGPQGNRFSPLTQLTPANVAGLSEIWRFDTGVGGLQTSPLIVGRTLYGFTPTQNVFALDAGTGSVVWTFDPGPDGLQPARGLSYWRDGSDHRLFAGVMHELWALDPRTGKPIRGFGEDGKIDLRKGLNDQHEANVTYLTSPGVIYRDLIIVGFRTAETKPAAPGAVRAYDVRTGQMKWIFHFIPRPGQPGHETWPEEAWKSAGGANAWAGLVVDEDSGIVFIPTGSAVDDFYGADRIGDNLYANSLVALDAATGQRLWHFQGVHHDIWDRDFPSPPVLLTVERDGRRIDAVAQTSKQGFVFVFERRTGRPLFPIEERPVPASDTPGERTSPTQPFPVAPEPFARQRLTADILTKRSPEAHAAALEAFKKFHDEGPFTPLEVDRPTVVFPGFDGGAEWGGPAADPQRGIIYINSNDIAWTGSLVLAARTRITGAQFYQTQCAVCHGFDRKGSPPDLPSLIGIGARMSAEEILAVVRAGRGRMPAFPYVTGDSAAALTEYLTAEGSARSDKREVESPSGAVSAASYLFTGYKKFLDPDGYPAVAPPWGTLNAIDLNDGRYLWKIPLGEYPALVARGMRDTGSENYGGPIVTAGGVLFIGATIYDRKFRAFEAATGRLLWESTLPFAGNATPVTYMVGSRQFVAIAASGARDRNGPQGSAYIAFALPGKSGP